MIENKPGGQKQNTVPATNPVFDADIVVSLLGGAKLGRYGNGETIPSAGKTFEEVMRLIAIQSIFPTYTPATLSLSQSASATGEVGESLNNTLTATFTRNDAEVLTAIRIQKNNSDLDPENAIGITSPFQKTDAVTRVLGSITYRALVSYQAGALKTITPDNVPDTRAAAIRTTNAPQAAQTDFASANVLLNGFYKIFFDPIAAPPTNSAQVRLLAARFTNGGNTFTLNTGTVHKSFTVNMPATMNLVSVVDLDALSDVVTSSYVLSLFNVNDAAGSPVAYKSYTMTNALPYTSSHRHQITVN